MKMWAIVVTACVVVLLVVGPCFWGVVCARYRIKATEDEGVGFRVQSGRPVEFDVWRMSDGDKEFVLYATFSGELHSITDSALAIVERKDGQMFLIPIQDVRFTDRVCLQEGK